MNLRRYFMLLASLLMLNFASCKSTSSSRSDISGLIDTAVPRWPNPERIPVCYMTPQRSQYEIQSQQHVTTEFAEKLGIHLVGWGTCNAALPTSPEIRIELTYLAKNHPTVGGGESSLGAVVSRSSTMRLNIPDASTFPSALSSTMATYVHEFGHALGLRHEHQLLGSTEYETMECKRILNPDASGVSENNFDAPSPTDLSVGGYSKFSLMGYCHAYEVPYLSASDVFAINQIYPQLNRGDSWHTVTRWYHTESKDWVTFLMADDQKSIRDHGYVTPSGQFFSPRSTDITLGGTLVPVNRWYHAGIDDWVTIPELQSDEVMAQQGYTQKTLMFYGWKQIPAGIDKRRFARVCRWFHEPTKDWVTEVDGLYPDAEFWTPRKYTNKTCDFYALIR